MQLYVFLSFMCLCVWNNLHLKQLSILTELHYSFLVIRLFQFNFCITDLIGFKLSMLDNCNAASLTHKNINFSHNYYTAKKLTTAITE